MNGGSHGLPRQFPRPAQVAGVRLRIGGERNSDVLFGLPREPLLLCRHDGRIRLQESQTVNSVVKYKTVQLPRLRLLDDLARFVEALQGEQSVGKVNVGTDIITATLAQCRLGFFILPPQQVDGAFATYFVFPWVALDRLLIRLRSFVQFSGHTV